MAMEALPIFIDALLPAWGAIVISVTLILAFGEIIPQAICSRYGLSVGAKLSVFVRVLLFVLFPLSYPISKLLDWLLGKGHSALLRRAELKAFVDMHGNKAGKGGELTQEETTIITGALDMTLKTAKDAMTPLSKLFSLDINSKLDEEIMEMVLRKGHSRVPIYLGHPTNIIGIILVKNLIKFRPQDDTPIRDLTIRKVPRVRDNLPLYDILKQFQHGHSHMAVVIRSHTEVKESKGFGDHYCQNEKLIVSVDSSSVNFHKSELESTTQRTVVELGHTTLKSQLKKANLDDDSALNGKSKPDLDEDVIGIITLEDVMEELLQEEILDETDEYVAVHNKLKVNMKALRRSTSGSPGASHLRWISPVTSPLSPYHHSPLSSSYNQSPILHSPIPPFIQSSFTRPTLFASGNSFQASPTASAAPPHGSPSSHKVSRKPYEKLRQQVGS